MRIVNQSNIEKIIHRIESLMQKTEGLHDDAVARTIDHEWYRHKIDQLNYLSRRNEIIYAELANLVHQLNEEYKAASSRVAHDARRLRNVIKL